MTENNQLIDLELLPEDTDITIVVNTGLYKRLQDMIFQAIPFKDLNHFTETIQKIKSENTKSDPVAYHLWTLLWLSQAIEEECKKKGLMVKKQFSTKEGKIVE